VTGEAELINEFQILKDRCKSPFYIDDIDGKFKALKKLIH
jgi:hypothetical protein